MNCDPDMLLCLLERACLALDGKRVVPETGNSFMLYHDNKLLKIAWNSYELNYGGTYCLTYDIRVDVDHYHKNQECYEIMVDFDPSEEEERATMLIRDEILNG
jgi:hypothetical protein